MVEYEDPLLGMKVKMFKRDWALLIKSRFLINTLDYVIAEMTSWQAGCHDSKFRKKSFMMIFEEELLSWPGKLGSDNNWDDFILGYIGNKKNIFPIGIATVFSDPALLCNYVGINLNPYSTCPSGLLQAVNGELPESDLPAYKIIEKNPYYEECRNNFENNFNPPKYPKGVGVADVLLMTVPAIVVFFFCYVTFLYIPSWIIRVLAIALSGFLIFYEFVREWPVEKRYREYSNEYDRMKTNVLNSDEQNRRKHKTITI